MVRATRIDDASADAALAPHGQDDDHNGATAVEYAMFVALIAVVIVVTVGFLGTSVYDLFTDPDLLDAFKN